MDMMSYLMGRNSGSAKKGAKIEVVTELPETGEANVIYLVPKQDEDENNVFDEYIWINDDWELIGTTDVDLSNYLAKDNITSYTPTGNYNPATKKYVDDSIANKQDVLTAGSNITIENNVISSTGGTEEVPSYVLNMHTEHNGLWYLELDNIDKARIGEIFTDAYEKGYESINVLLKYKTTASVYAYQVLLIPLNRVQNSLTIQNKPTVYKLTSVYHSEEDINYVDNTASLRFGLCLLYFYGSWTNNVFTVTTASYKTYAWALPTDNGVLTKTNTAAYTPMSNYHPSTKLYTDLAVAKASGLLPYATNKTYQLGDYVYRSATDPTLYKCKVATTSGSWAAANWEQKTYMEYLSDTLVGGALNGSY